jgi:hypothetical protein
MENALRECRNARKECESVTMPLVRDELNETFPIAAITGELMVLVLS